MRRFTQYCINQMGTNMYSLLFLLMLFSTSTLADVPDGTVDRTSRPSIVVGADGKEKVLIFGEERDKADIAFDVDGDKVYEDLASRLEAKPGAMHSIQVKVAGPINDGAIKAINAQVVKGDFVRSFTENGLNHFVVVTSEQGVRNIARLPFVESVMTNERVYTTSMYEAKENSGVNFAALSAYGIGNPQGLENPSSPINGDMDGNPAFHSTSDAVIAIVDTGIDLGHIAFPGGYQGNQNGIGINGPKIIGWKDTTTSPSQMPVDPSTNGHGTHVANIAAGHAGNNNDGIAPGAALVGVRVAEADGTTSSFSDGTTSLTRGLNWILNVGIDQLGIDVVNLSLGTDACVSSTDNSIENTLLNAIMLRGVNVVVSIGNSAKNVIGGTGMGTRCNFNFLAANGGTISVGWIDDPSNDTGWGLASPSSRGPTSDGYARPSISAPGRNIYSANANSSNGYKNLSGSSMSAPFVSGVVAALLDAGLTGSGNRKAAIEQSAFHFGSNYDSIFGAGYIQPLEAYKRAIPSPSQWGLNRTITWLPVQCTSLNTPIQAAFTITIPGIAVAYNIISHNYSYKESNGSGFAPLYKVELLDQNGTVIGSDTNSANTRYSSRVYSFNLGAGAYTAKLTPVDSVGTVPSEGFCSSFSISYR